MLKFHPEARKEFKQATRWYDDKSPPLGSDFNITVNQKIAHILEYPANARLTSHGCRVAYIIERFLYKIIYRVTTERIEIIAVAHAKRADHYWHRRV